jgi:hypothetical protein
VRAAAAQVIVMGCAGMVRRRHLLEEALSVQVIDPTRAAVAMAMGAVQAQMLWPPYTADSQIDPERCRSLCRPAPLSLRMVSTGALAMVPLLTTCEFVLRATSPLRCTQSKKMGGTSCRSATCLQLLF